MWVAREMRIAMSELRDDERGVEKERRTPVCKGVFVASFFLFAVVVVSPIAAVVGPAFGMPWWLILSICAAALLVACFSFALAYRKLGQE